ncbi:pimeloyl-ACP methyl ester carboxylesterase [Silvibacterium bohemicum]|uniref:Pimeloyl-ACP methyl ester carboxylesterase n=1 Tax=Silvibacterium bohemicum TaxID=1577686 RepID=A0A841JVE2_9BACT|nr:alpha/beta hydrolase [Silvibacterium bohemicum]MBB6144437.1 pimeloyl-ACP methyl ester carboxylesterase [Silvibacterium bohemicum]
MKIEHHRITANGLNQHYVDAGSGPAVILLHGFPETSYAWRHQIPVLGQSYRLIIPDLRGYGATEKPDTGYDKRTMANDIVALMSKLGIEKAAIIGHDRGVRVATRLVKDHPEVVARFGALDNIPTRVIFENVNANLAQGAWFFFFNSVPDLPEALIHGREEMWLRYTINSWAYRLDAFNDADIAEYVKAYSQPGGLRGPFADYRAWRQDLEQDQVDRDVKITCPTLALWGRDFVGAKVVDMAAVWKGMADDLSTCEIPFSGHFPQAEQPEATNAALLDFLNPWQG